MSLLVQGSEQTPMPLPNARSSVAVPPTPHPAFAGAATYLSQIDIHWAAHVARIGPCLHVPKPAREPYEALVRAVAYQQLHAKAGDAILGRFLALYPQGAFPTPTQLLDTDPSLQRACGFSGSKLATIRRIAEARLEGVVPSRQLAVAMPDEVLIERLSSIRGIGRWTVEMLLIYSLARADVLPGDDFGVREGYRRLKSIEKAPSPRDMREIGQLWAPHRTAASWYLWQLTAPKTSTLK
jgi:DNA-3-methyladenine glycosylase II